VAAEQLYKVAYDEAVRTLAEQQAAIESVRSRAELLLSAAAITTSFLGAQALRGDSVDSVSWLALISFVGVAAASLAILWPRRWEVATSPRKVIVTYIESADTLLVDELYRDLSLHMHRGYSENYKGLRKLFVFVQIASVLLVAEVMLWIAAVALAT
jgi:hypothetical protein